MAGKGETPQILNTKIYLGGRRGRFREEGNPKETLLASYLARYIYGVLLLRSYDSKSFHGCKERRS